MPYQTKQQQAVLACFSTQPEEALSANAVLDQLRSQGLTVGFATIYRQLEKLEQLGVLHRITTSEGAVYQYCTHQDHHQECFLIRCKQCGKIRHLDCDHLGDLYAHLQQEHAFTIDLHDTILTGLCDVCGKEALHG